MDDLSHRRERRERRDGVWLALVPVGVAVLLGLLLIPRRAVPEGVPLPIADARAMQRVWVTDRELADQARREPLPGPVRALGSAIREFHSLEARDADARSLAEARRAVDVALVDAVPVDNEALLRLRAVELASFLDEVAHFEATGTESAELHALAGGFVRSMRNEGWCDGHTLAPPSPVLRVMFKQMWSAFIGLERSPDLAPTLDEQRSLYAFYLSHAHPSKAMREAIGAARRGARDAKACRALVDAERAATESWRLDRIARIAAIDPAYPADYARGVCAFGQGEYGASATAFRSWLRDHPQGPYALRAQNYLRAAADGDRPE
ncbi:MAG: hypothetical protein M3O46_23755 [Myxococcota bacterium]|nr:hypothetical protein [Myxococcota bacterium]